VAIDQAIRLIERSLNSPRWLGNALIHSWGGEMPPRRVRANVEIPLAQPGRHKVISEVKDFPFLTLGALYDESSG
jgi:hypothetical protein